MFDFLKRLFGNEEQKEFKKTDEITNISHSNTNTINKENNKLENNNNFNDCFTIIEKGGKYGYINTKGEEVIECKFDEAYDFNEGLARVKKYSKEFIINNKGNYIVYDENKNPIEVSGEFDDIYYFKEGLARVEKDRKYGYINTKGEEVIECKFDHAYDFNEGLARVEKYSKEFIINNKGNYIVYDENKNQIEILKETMDKSNNIFLFSKNNNKFGLLDKDYNIIIKYNLESEFEVIQRINENTFLIKMAGKDFFVDCEGNLK